MNEVPVVLLVEDDDDDYYLTVEGFRRTDISVKMERVENGLECMNFLKQLGKYANKPVPDIILLDLNMPLMDGREVLKHLTADPHLQHLPVVVLSTSANVQDIEEMYRQRCNSYIVKPVDFNEFLDTIREFSHYWFSLVTMPRLHP